MKLKKIFALALATSLVLPGVSALADDDFDDYDDISYDYDDLDDDDRKTSSKSETRKALRELKVSVLLWLLLASHYSFLLLIC